MLPLHHFHLPDHSRLLAGRAPRDEFGFASERLQIWYNRTTETWRDETAQAHLVSDECFIVLRGELIVELEGERLAIGAREFCFFPRGVYHAVVEVHPPVESLMIRAPSVDDKVCRQAEGRMPKVEG